MRIFLTAIVIMAGVYHAAWAFQVGEDVETGGLLGGGGPIACESPWNVPKARIYVDKNIPPGKQMSARDKEILDALGCAKVPEGLDVLVVDTDTGQPEVIKILIKASNGKEVTAFTDQKSIDKGDIFKLFRQLGGH